MNLQASGIRMAIGVAECVASTVSDWGDMKSPDLDGSGESSCMSGARDASPDYPEVVRPSLADVSTPSLLIVRSNVCPLLRHIRTSPAGDGYAGFRVHRAISSARQKHGGIAGIRAVASGRFRRCHTPRAAKNRPSCAQSWHGFYLAISRPSDFNSRNRLTCP